MDRLKQIFSAVLQTEENVLPLFIHNPVSQEIEAVVIAAESVILDFVESLKKPASAAPPAAPPAS